jgi:Spy/CpxP family protein refolding chaperone
MRPRVKGALLLCLAFVLGITTGALGLGLYQARTGWWGPRRDPARLQQFRLRRLTRELDLRPEQRQQVEGILRDSGKEFVRLREEIRPRFQEIRGRTRDRIRAALDAEQQARFDALAEQWDRQADRWRGRDQPSGNGGSKQP